MRRILSTILILLALSGAASAVSVVQYSTPTGTYAANPSVNSAFGSNVTSGNVVIVYCVSAGAVVCATPTKQSGTSTIGTFSAAGTPGSNQALYCASVTGTGSLTVHGSGTSGTNNLTIVAGEATGVNCTVDAVAYATFSYCGSCTWTSITTTVNGDLVIPFVQAGGNVTLTMTSTFSPITFSTYVSASSSTLGSSSVVQSSFAAIHATGTASASGTDAIIALEPSTPTVAGPTFSLAGGTYNSSLPRSTTAATITAGAYLCVTVCTTSGCTPTTPTAPTAGTCSVGTQYSTNSQSLTLPVGYETISALGTESGYLNSSVTTSGQYLSQPTIIGLGGIGVSNLPGTVNALNGTGINPYTGYIGGSNGFAMPFTASVAQNFIDFHGGTNTAAPTTTTLANSTYGPAGTWLTSGELGAGMTYSNGLTSSLYHTIDVGGTVYSSSGSLGLECVSENGTVTATYCGHAILTYANPGASSSLGFTYQSPNCNKSLSIDCGAAGGLGSPATDYVVVHTNPSGGGCSSYNGIELESFGGTVGCLAYVNGATYRFNIQENVGEAAITATFTNGSAAIGGTNTLAVNQAIQLSTTGALPTNFTACASPGGCFVVSTGLSGSGFQLATKQNGTPIVAGSAGSGTQTATVMNTMSVCIISGGTYGYVGTLFAPAATSGAANGQILTGFTGEGPAVVGYTFYFKDYALDIKGDISTTGCIL